MAIKDIGYRCCADVFITCCSVTKLYLTLCDPMDCSMPGLSVSHHLLEFAQVYVHWISDAIHNLGDIIYISYHPLISYYVYYIYTCLTANTYDILSSEFRTHHKTFIAYKLLISLFISRTEQVAHLRKIKVYRNKLKKIILLNINAALSYEEHCIRNKTLEPISPSLSKIKIISKLWFLEPFMIILCFRLLVLIGIF